MEQCKISQQTKNQKTLNLPGKGQSTDANADMTQILEGSEEDLKAVAIQIFQPAIVNILETNGKIASAKKLKI